MDKKSRVHLEEIGLEQDEVLGLLVGGKPIDGFEFDRKLEGFGERVVYANSDGQRRVYDLETGEFVHEYGRRVSKRFNNPELAIKMAYVSTRLQYFGKNTFNDAQGR